MSDLFNPWAWSNGKWKKDSSSGPDWNALETSPSNIHNDVIAEMDPVPQHPNQLKLNLFWSDGQPSPRTLGVFNGNGIDGPNQNVVMPTFGSRLVLTYAGPSPAYQPRLTYYDTLTSAETQVSPGLPGNFLGTISGYPSADGREFALNFNTSPNGTLASASCVTQFRDYATGAVQRTITTLGRCGFGIAVYPNLVGPATAPGVPRGGRRPQMVLIRHEG